MPSSLIFASLVVLWLLILVPAVARHQQEVARPSTAALSGRVLERPQRRLRTEEVDEVHDTEDDRADAYGAHIDGASSRVPVAVGSRSEQAGTRIPEARAGDRGLGPDQENANEGYPDPEYRGQGYGGQEYGDQDYQDYRDDDGRWERPAPRYRPGRGGFDPEAAALAARARYAFRQRVVLGMLIAAAVTAVVAILAVPGVWWLHAGVDLALVGYLIYLRTQVRMEEAIRDRRAARMAGTHRSHAADDPELDAWARRGREVAHRRTAPVDAEDDLEDDDLVDDPHGDSDGDRDLDGDGDRDPDGDLVEGRPGRRTDRSAARSALPEPVRVEDEPALPRLAPAPPPPLPAGTTVVDDDLEDPELHDLDGPVRPDYRRAAGE